MWIADRVPVSTARRAGLAVAVLRVLLGVAALVAPEPLGRAWIGSGAAGRDRSVLLRGLAARDIALGSGALLARSSEDLGRWVAMGALADLGDTVATLGAFSALPRRTRWALLAACAGASVTGASSSARCSGAR